MVKTEKSLLFEFVSESGRIERQMLKYPQEPHLKRYLKKKVKRKQKLGKRPKLYRVDTLAERLERDAFLQLYRKKKVKPLTLNEVFGRKVWFTKKIRLL